MSAARDHANDLDTVAPFIPLGIAASLAMTQIYEARTSFHQDHAEQADERARFAIEGGPIQPADVPGNPSTTHTTTGA